MSDVDLTSAILQAFRTNQRINEILLDALADEVWRAPRPFGRGRDIAHTFAHLHKARLMWLKVIAPKAPRVDECDAEVASQSDVTTLLRLSFDALEAVIRDALEHGRAIKHFTAGPVGLVAYFISHEAHHRGQVCMLTKALGKPLPDSISYGIWDWNALTSKSL